MSLRKVVSVAVTVSAVLAAPLWAGETQNIQLVTPNQGVNQQSATGSVNQSPVGGINSNYQINNSAATDYGFGPGIYCRGSHLSIGGFSSRSNGGADGILESSFQDVGGVVAFSVPLPSTITENCKSWLPKLPCNENWTRNSI